MRFKDWLLQTELASVYHGGIQDIPGSYLNVNMPVQSKISTKDGFQEPEDVVAKEKAKHKPDLASRIFGFKGKDKIRSRERASQYIDRDRKRVPMERIPPDIVY